MRSIDWSRQYWEDDWANRYLLKGNVSPCLLICSNTSGLQSVLRTMNGGEQILSSSKKKEREHGENWTKKIELKKAPEEFQLNRNNDVKYISGISLMWTSRKQEKYAGNAAMITLIINKSTDFFFIFIIDWLKIDKSEMSGLNLSMNTSQSPRSQILSCLKL